MSGPKACTSSEPRSFTLFHYLLSRESCSRSVNLERWRAYQSYRAVVPNATARARQPGITNAHFSPDGRHLIGLNNQGNSVQIWRVGGAVGSSHGGEGAAGPRASVPAATSQPPVSVAHPRSNPTSLPASAPQRQHPPLHSSTAAAPAQSDLRHGSLRSSNGGATMHALQQIVPPRARSTVPLTVPPITFAPARHMRSELTPIYGPVPLPGITSKTGSAGASGVGAAAAASRNASLSIAWRQRERDQRALIAEWERNRRERRRQESRRSGTKSATPPPVARGATPPPPQPPRAPPPSTPVISFDDDRDGASGEVDAAARMTDLSAHFTLRVTASVTTGGHTLHDDSCLFTPDGRHVLLLAEAPRVPATTGGGATGAGPGTGTAAAASSVLMVAVADGSVADRIHLPGEALVRRGRNGGATWSLAGDTLVLLAARMQELLVLKCSAGENGGKAGLVHMCTHGAELDAGDAWTLQQAEHAEALQQCVHLLTALDLLLHLSS